MSAFNATTSVEASNLFNVNGLVAVVTGGGTGSSRSPVIHIRRSSSDALQVSVSSWPAP